MNEVIEWADGYNSKRYQPVRCDGARLVYVCVWHYCVVDWSTEYRDYSPRVFRFRWVASVRADIGSWRFKRSEFQQIRPDSASPPGGNVSDCEALEAALDQLSSPLDYRDHINVIFAAARQLLAGQKVWWCLEHKSSGETVNHCWQGMSFRQATGNKLILDECRMVEAVLVIPDA